MKKLLVIMAFLAVAISGYAQEANDSTKKKSQIIEKIILDRTFSVTDNAVMFSKSLRINKSSMSVYEWMLSNDRIGETNIITFKIKNMRTGHTEMQTWSENTHIRMDIYDDGTKAYYVEDDLFHHLMIVPSQGTYGIIMNSVMKKK